MISKRVVKFIKSLQIKKYRKQEQCFLVEGKKSVLELLRSDYNIHIIVATSLFIEEHKNIIESRCEEVYDIGFTDLNAMGVYKTNDSVLAVAAMKEETIISPKTNGHILALDNINDPGNLGTIIRTADWFGIYQVVCSPHCADLYNPKVISATKGSFTRVNVCYTNLMGFISEYSSDVYGAFLNGENVSNISFPNDALLLLGNEAKGIDENLVPHINKKVSIPKYGEAESLNVAIATGILCHQMKVKL